MLKYSSRNDKLHLNLFNQFSIVDDSGVLELYSFVLPLFCVLVNSFVSTIELPGCCVV